MSTPHVAGMSRRSRFAVLGGLMIGLAAPLAAPSPQQAPATEKECRTALRIVEKGKPAKKEAWALALAPRCPVADAVLALAAMVRSLRTEAETAALFEALAPTWRVIDEGLLLAALDVIGDNTATMNARIATTFTVASQISDGMLVMYWDGAISGIPGCNSGLTGSVALTKGAEPTVATLRSAAGRLRAVVSAPTTPNSVRNAVACVLGDLESVVRRLP